MNEHDIDWAALRAPFDPGEVDFRIQSTFQRDGKTKAVVVAYIDARAVQERLDAVAGPQHWSFDWEPLATKDGAVTAAKGTLTIAGVSKSDVGDAGKTEPTKASVSDALKRAAVMWGVGRYIYGVPVMYAEVEQRGSQDVLARGEMERLRAALPRPIGPARRQAATVTLMRPDAQQQATQDAEPPATELQLASIRKLCTALGKAEPEEVLTYNAARTLIAALSAEYEKSGRSEGQRASVPTVKSEVTTKQEQVRVAAQMPRVIAEEDQKQADPGNQRTFVEQLREKGGTALDVRVWLQKHLQRAVTNDELEKLKAGTYAMTRLEMQRLIGVLPTYQPEADEAEGAVEAGDIPVGVM